MSQALGRLGAIYEGATPPLDGVLIWRDTVANVHRAWNGVLPVSNPANWLPLGNSLGLDYTRSQPVPQAIGGIPVGYQPTGDIRNTLDALLYPYQAPSFTAFSLNLAGVYEVGQQIPAQNFLFNWAVSNAQNINPNSLVIRDQTNNQVLADALANDGSESIPYGPLVLGSVGSVVFRIQGQNTQSGLFIRDTSIQWSTRRLRGVIPTSARAALETVTSFQDILDLIAANPGAAIDTNDLTYSRQTGGGTFNLSAFAPDGGHIFWLWDQALGDASFLQGAVTFPVDKTVVTLQNQYGISRTYRLFIGAVATSGAAINVNVQ